MARKHDKFSYSYGWKTAPEQWSFYWNGKLIQLDSDTRSQVALLMLSGKEADADAILKRLLRKQEKEDSDICIGFYAENSNQYYFTLQLKCSKNDMQGKLYSYKEWKHYIQSKNCYLSTHEVTSGYFIPNGKEPKEKKEAQDKIDLNRPVIIRLVKAKQDKIFQF